MLKFQINNFHSSDLIINIQDILFTNHKIDDALSEIVNLCGTYFKVSRFIIGIFDENINEYTFQYKYEDIKTKKLNFKSMTMPGKNNNEGLKLLLDKKIYLCNNTKKTEFFNNLKPYFNKYSIFSTIFTGLWCNGYWYGKIGMHECFRERNWNNLEIKLLEDISKLISIYLELEHSKEIISIQNEKINHLEGNLKKSILTNNTNILDRKKKNTKIEKLISSAENRVLNYVIEGHTNFEIAKKLNLSKRTIETHLTSMFAKLQIRNRVQLTRLVIDSNLST
jgi:DNA-binding CsgD family transcriptional regulator